MTRFLITAAILSLVLTTGAYADSKPVILKCPTHAVPVCTADKTKCTCVNEKVARGGVGSDGGDGGADGATDAADDGGAVPDGHQQPPITPPIPTVKPTVTPTVFSPG